MRVPKYEIIYKEIVIKIETGVFKENHKLPTEIEMAKQYDVSRITITRAYKELADNRFVYRVKGHGTYVSGRHKRLSTTSSKPNQYSFISVVLQNNSYMNNLLKGIEQIMSQEGYLVTFHNSMGSNTNERKIINDIVKKGSSGIILYPNDTAMNTNLYSKLINENFPIVSIDRTLANLRTPHVSVDNYKSFYIMTKHLLDLGHRNITFVATSLYSISSELDRYRGFCQACSDAGVSLSDNHLFYMKNILDLPENYRLDNETYSEAISYIIGKILSNPKESRTSAIACVNDEIARLIMKELLHRGIHIPKEIAITGFDDLPFSEHLHVPLTTMKQPLESIGVLAAKELLKSIKSPKRYLMSKKIPTELIVRESTNIYLKKK